MVKVAAKTICVTPLSVVRQGSSKPGIALRRHRISSCLEETVKGLRKPARLGIEDDAIAGAGQAAIELLCGWNSKAPMGRYLRVGLYLPL